MCIRLCPLGRTTADRALPGCDELEVINERTYRVRLTVKVGFLSTRQDVRMEIVEATAPSKVALKLDFVKPFEAHNTVQFDLIPKGELTEVVWDMQGPVPYVAKIMHVFVNMDRMVGADFEAGLANLKTLAEK